MSEHFSFHNMSLGNLQVWEALDPGPGPWTQALGALRDCKRAVSPALGESMGARGNMGAQEQDKEAKRLKL